jgi:hypothetical protein
MQFIEQTSPSYRVTTEEPQQQYSLPGWRQYSLQAASSSMLHSLVHHPGTVHALYILMKPHSKSVWGAYI